MQGEDPLKVTPLALAPYINPYNRPLTLTPLGLVVIDIPLPLSYHPLLCPYYPLPFSPPSSYLFTIHPSLSNHPPPTIYHPPSTFLTTHHPPATFRHPWRRPTAAAPARR